VVVVVGFVVRRGASRVQLGVESAEQALALVALAHAQHVHAARMLVEHLAHVARRQLIGRDDARELLRHGRLLLKHTTTPPHTRGDHISPVLRELRWLPIRQRVKFKVACLVRQSLSGQAPLYLADDCRLVSDSTRRSLRSTDV